MGRCRAAWPKPSTRQRRVVGAKKQHGRNSSARPGTTRANAPRKAASARPALAEPEPRGAERSGPADRGQAATRPGPTGRGTERRDAHTRAHERETA
eukprot:964511-Alexandrium_andersonii.AAC.1